MTPLDTLSADERDALAGEYVLVNQPPADAPRFLVVLVAPQDKVPGWVVQASDTRSVSLIPLTTVEVPADKALEFWTKADGWQGPVSLGLVKPDQTLSVPLDKLPPLQPRRPAARCAGSCDARLDRVSPRARWYRHRTLAPAGWRCACRDRAAFD